MSHHEDKRDSEEKVGYKNPPKTTRFKKGQSGNPKGRPKIKYKSWADDFREEMQSPIKIRENGQEIVVTKQRAIAKTTLAGALKGNIKQLNVVEKMIEKSSQNEEMFPKIEIEIIDCETKPIAKDDKSSAG